MTDRCSGATSRQRTYSSDDSSCQPTDEQSEARAVAREQEAEREAEAHRNAYFAANTDEGGRSSRASSDTRSYSPMLHDDPQLKASRRTAALDPPLLDDPYGNAIVAAAAGGLISGVRAASAEALVPHGRSVAQHIATQTAKGIAKGVAKGIIKSTMTTGPEMPSDPIKPAPQGSGSSSTPAGQTSSKATSEAAPEPNQSFGPVRIPFVVQG
jgi:hypothetical protein